MSTEETRLAYDAWSAQYDTNRNRTRDLEAIALRETLDKLHGGRCLEIGCGTGKNTEWLASRCAGITAVDLSAGMLAKARTRVIAPHVVFRQADILQRWTFATGLYDLVTFSLVLEHIQDLDPILQKAQRVLAPGGRVYVGELHPFKQYSGTKARFETPEGTRTVPCSDHHVSEFIRAAQRAGLHIEDLREYFDPGEPMAPPRLLVLMFRK